MDTGKLQLTRDLRISSPVYNFLGFPNEIVSIAMCIGKWNDYMQIKKTNMPRLRNEISVITKCLANVNNYSQ